MTAMTRAAVSASVLCAVLWLTGSVLSAVDARVVSGGVVSRGRLVAGPAGVDRAVLDRLLTVRAGQSKKKTKAPVKRRKDRDNDDDEDDEDDNDDEDESGAGEDADQDQDEDEEKEKKDEDDPAAIEKTIASQASFMSTQQMLQSIFTIFASRKIMSLDYSRPEVLARARLVFIAYLIFSHLLYWGLKFIIKQENDRTVVARSAASPLQDMLKKSPLGSHPLAQMLSSSAFGKSDAAADIPLTVKQYDLHQNRQLFNSLFFEILGASYMHFLAKKHSSLMLVPLWGVASKLKAPLVLLRVFRLKAVGPLARPFKSQMELMMEGLTKQGAATAAAAAPPSAAVSQGADQDQDSEGSEEEDSDKSSKARAAERESDEEVDVEVDEQEHNDRDDEDSDQLPQEQDSMTTSSPSKDERSSNSSGGGSGLDQAVDQSLDGLDRLIHELDDQPLDRDDPQTQP